MVQNAAEGKEDVRSVSAEQGCSLTESSNKLVYLTSRITALRPVPNAAPFMRRT